LRLPTNRSCRREGGRGSEEGRKGERGIVRTNGRNARTKDVGAFYPVRQTDTAARDLQATFLSAPRGNDPLINVAVAV
jgi:hypothetical protein